MIPNWPPDDDIFDRLMNQNHNASQLDQAILALVKDLIEVCHTLTCFNQELDDRIVELEDKLN
jgi:hypothetical protein